MKTKVCPKCGKNEFIVIERLFHDAEFDEEGVLTAHHCFDNETYSVICKHCDFELDTDDIEIDYCG